MGGGVGGGVVRGWDPKMGHASAHEGEGLAKNKKEHFTVHRLNVYTRKARTIGDDAATQCRVMKKGSFLGLFSIIGFIPLWQGGDSPREGKPPRSAPNGRLHAQRR